VPVFLRITFSKLKGGKMKKATISLFMIASFWLAGYSFATSPMPEEVKPGQKENVCTARIVYVSEHEGAVVNEESSSVLAFDAAVSKRGVLDKITSYMDNKLSEGNVSEFKFECKFIILK